MQRLLMTVFTGMTMAAAASGTHAGSCYVLYDRSDNVVYQDTFPPVDLSDQGAAQREALRRRGEYLMIMESDLCPQVSFVFGSGGSSTLSVDQIVGGFPASQSMGNANSGGAARAPGPASGAAATSRSNAPSRGYK